MEITSTEAQNNFGRYLKLAAWEDIIVTKNGKRVVVIKSYNREVGSHSVSEQANAYQRKISYQEFIKLSDTSDNRYEYIDGEVYLMSSPSYDHQRIIVEVLSIMYQWFRGKKCSPLTSPFDVTLHRLGDQDNINIVQPDILIICDTSKINSKGRYTGVPSLVVEVLSESEVNKDMVKKLDLYSESGISEYWIVNPTKQEVYLYHFKDYKVSQYQLCKATDIAESFLFKGLAVPVEHIFPHLI
ncbi:MAG: type II toxin-antitoxin system Phd/YefM family antitoxin [Clostridiaceae bacterium]|nr:type II toxin-antitoxin system Phd/YefM family antitoxin [Clostridiaceae bacterium]